MQGDTILCCARTQFLPLLRDQPSGRSCGAKVPDQIIVKSSRLGVRFFRARPAVRNRRSMPHRFPGAAKQAMTTVLEMSDTTLRIAGIVSALAGVLIVYLVRG